MSVWVCGEALIDLLPQGPVPGGGPANTAIALARLGIDVQFVGGISTDEHGLLLGEHLRGNGVDLSHALFSDLPTALAVVTVDERGSAQYEFRLEKTATFTIDSTQLPSGKPQVLHIGSLATVVEPAASSLFEWAVGLDVPIVFDPNVRPAVISDPDTYRTAMERWAAVASVIKLSDDDLAFLYRGKDQLAALRALMGPRAELVVLTRGAEGLLGVTRDQTVSVPGVAVDVVDTVGAGDTVGAVVVEAMSRKLPLVGDELKYVLERAVRASAITCSRAGCQPPFAHELAHE